MRKRYLWIGLVGLAVAIYGYSYTAAYAGRYSLRLLGFLLNMLLLSLCLQVLADNAFTFLLAWVKNHSLYIFAAYCAIVGTLYLLYTFLT